MREPLTVEELKKMVGKPVYCPEINAYGIVKYETVGRWAGIPYLVGVAQHDTDTMLNFEYNILAQKLKCYKIDTKFVENLF